MEDVVCEAAAATVARRDVYGAQFVTQCAVLCRATGVCLTGDLGSQYSVAVTAEETQRLTDVFSAKQWLDPGTALTLCGDRIVLLRELDDQTEIHAKVLGDTGRSAGLGATSRFLCIVLSDDATQGVNVFLATSLLLKALRAIEAEHPAT